MKNIPDNRTTVVIQASYQSWDAQEPITSRAAWDCVSTDAEAEQISVKVSPGAIQCVTEVGSLVTLHHKSVSALPSDPDNRINVSTENGTLVCWLKPGEMAVFRSHGKLSASSTRMVALLQVTVLPG